MLGFEKLFDFNDDGKLDFSERAMQCFLLDDFLSEDDDSYEDENEDDDPFEDGEEEE